MKTTRFLALVLVLTLLITMGGAAGAQEPLATANGGCVAGATYDPACDVNHDDDTNIIDLQLVANHWGQAGTWSPDAHNHWGELWSGNGKGLVLVSADDTGVHGETSSTSDYAAGVIGVVNSTTPGALSVGVRGINNGTGDAGIGVYGSQDGSGVGVYGTTLSGFGVYGAAIAYSGTNYGLYGRSNSGSGYGVYGKASATSGTNYGVHGQSDSSDGTGVYGLHAAASGTGPGVHGETSSTSSGAAGVIGVVNSTTPGGGSAGVRGINNGTGGNGIGVYGSQDGSGWGVYGTTPSGRGVYGEASATSGTNYGVYGQSNSTSGYGVYGEANATTGFNYGLYGKSISTSGYGVYGEANATSGTNYGVYGYSNATAGTGVGGRAPRVGVYALASATSGTNYGVFGASNSTTGIGVYGTAAYKGVYGRSDGTNGTAVFGWASGSNGYGVHGRATGSNGYAGYFQGNVHVTGSLSKGAGSFKIDHPLDPENKYLYHSFVESPDMMNIYNGNVTLNVDGEVWVELPKWFQALNQDFRYQLTPIGAPGPNLYIGQQIENNRFQIAGGEPGMEVSWQVTGIRHDAYAEAHRIPVEEEKPAKERGTYLHPVEHGQPKALGLDYQRNKDILEQPEPEAPVEPAEGE